MKKSIWLLASLFLVHSFFSCRDHSLEFKNKSLKNTPGKENSISVDAIKEGFYFISQDLSFFSKVAEAKETNYTDIVLIAEGGVHQKDLVEWNKSVDGLASKIVGLNKARQNENLYELKGQIQSLKNTFENCLEIFFRESEFTDLLRGILPVDESRLYGLDNKTIEERINQIKFFIDIFSNFSFEELNKAKKFLGEDNFLINLIEPTYKIKSDKAKFAQFLKKSFNPFISFLNELLSFYDEVLDLNLLHKDVEYISNDPNLDEKTNSINSRLFSLNMQLGLDLNNLPNPDSTLENYSNYSGEDYIFKKKVKQYTDILDQAVAFIETLEGSQNQPEASTPAN